MQFQTRADAYPLTTRWQKITTSNANLLGTTLQSHAANGTVKIYVGFGSVPVSQFHAVELLAGGADKDDIIPSNCDLYARCDTGTATLTVITKTR